MTHTRKKECINRRESTVQLLHWFHSRESHRRSHWTLGRTKFNCIKYTRHGVANKLKTFRIMKFGGFHTAECDSRPLQFVFKTTIFGQNQKSLCVLFCLLSGESSVWLSRSWKFAWTLFAIVTFQLWRMPIACSLLQNIFVFSSVPVNSIERRIYISRFQVHR